MGLLVVGNPVAEALLDGADFVHYPDLAEIDHPLARASLDADVAAEWFHEAMTWYERAEAMRPQGNDESILRWITCVRLLGRHQPSGRSAPREYEPALEE